MVGTATSHKERVNHDHSSGDNNNNDDMLVERWILPVGAEQIVRQIAAEQILHELLDRCCDMSNSSNTLCNRSHNSKQQSPTEENNNESSTTTMKDISTTSSSTKSSLSSSTTTTTSLLSNTCAASSDAIDFGVIEDVAREFPGVCRRTYEFQVDTRDAANRVRSLLPLAILCCLNPPLRTVQAVYEANPEAIAWLDTAKGATPLLYACSFEASLEVVDFLISKHPDSVQIPRRDGAIPLAMACSYRAPPSVVDRLIQEYPQGIRQASVDGWYPIHAAVACEAPVLAIQRLYQAFPESVSDTRNATGSTALHLACSKRASLEVVAFLVQVAPEMIRVEDSKRMTPWLWAVYTQALPVLQLLLERYGALPEQSPDGIYLLHFAARHNTDDVVDFLAQRYPSMVSARTRSNGMTPLHTACRRSRSLSVIQALVRHNPRCLFIRNQRGRCPLDEAREAKASAEVIDFLIHEQRARRAWWW